MKIKINNNNTTESSSVSQLILYDRADVCVHHQHSRQQFPYFLGYALYVSKQAKETRIFRCRGVASDDYRICLDQGLERLHTFYQMSNTYGTSK